LAGLWWWPLYRSGRTSVTASQDGEATPRLVIRLRKPDDTARLNGNKTRTALAPDNPLPLFGTLAIHFAIDPSEEYTNAILKS